MSHDVIWIIHIKSVEYWYIKLECDTCLFKAVNMLQCVVLVLCVAFCAGCGIPSFNLSIVYQHNKTGKWHAWVQLDHENEQPLNIYVNHTATNTRCSHFIDIVPNLPELPDIVANLSELPDIVPNLPELPVSVPEVEKTCIRKQPSPGYELLPGLGYYKVHTERKTWHYSKARCIQEDAHLVIINSEEEALSLGNLTIVRKSPRNTHWVGFHDQYSNGQYVTIFNESLQSTGFEKWYPGYPKNEASYPCGFFIYNEASQYGLGDLTCEFPYPFICEQDICY